MRKEKRAGKGKKNDNKEETAVYSLDSHLTCLAFLSTVEQRGNHSVDAYTAKEFWSLYLVFWRILRFASEYLWLYMGIFK